MWVTEPSPADSHYKYESKIVRRNEQFKIARNSIRGVVKHLIASPPDNQRRTEFLFSIDVNISFHISLGLLTFDGTAVDTHVAAASFAVDNKQALMDVRNRQVTQKHRLINNRLDADEN